MSNSLYECSTCKIDVSQTTIHCTVCGTCVYGFDHHSYWLNTCIGFKHFRTYIILCLVLLATSCSKIAWLLIHSAFINESHLTRFLGISQFIIDFILMLGCLDQLTFQLNLRRLRLSAFEFYSIKKPKPKRPQSENKRSLKGGSIERDESLSNDHLSKKQLHRRDLHLDEINIQSRDPLNPEVVLPDEEFRPSKLGRDEILKTAKRGQSTETSNHQQQVNSGDYKRNGSPSGVKERQLELEEPERPL